MNSNPAYGRIIRLLLIAMLAICMTLSVATAENCDHDWNSITGVCKTCGAECIHTFDAKSRCTVCRYRCAHPAHDAQSLICETCEVETAHDFQDGACSRCDATTIFMFKELDASYAEPAANPGTVEAIYYDTYAYAVEAAAGLDHKSLPVQNKRAFVYLPHGYDPAKQYDVLYLLHGGGGTEGAWFDIIRLETSEVERKFEDTLSLLDNLFERGEVEPCIVVTPTLYTYAPEGSEYASYTEGLSFTENFQYEMPDIIGAVEATYSTYANGDTSYETLIATRAHRAYAGLSMGSMTSFQSIICGNMDIIGYVGSFSGALTEYSLIEKALTETYKDYPIYYWYHGEGTADMAHDEHIALYNEIKAGMPQVVTEGVNYIMVDKPGFAHTADNWYIDLYNVLQVFFTLD